MAVKSIIEIAVNDERFKAFKATFDKYTKALSETKPKWEEAGQAAQEAAEVTAEITAEVEKQVKVHEKKVRVQEKEAQVQEKQTKELGKQSKELESQAQTQERADRAAEKAEKTRTTAQKKRLDDAKKSMGQIRDNASSVAGFLAKGTGSLLKWAGFGGVLGGLLGGGGLLGLDALGSSVSNTRRSALGYGVQPGDLQAFRVNFGRFVDPNGLLQNITEAQADPAKAWAFGAMGLQNYRNRSAADLGADALGRAQSMWKRGGYNIQSAQGQTLQALGFSVEDLNRLRNAAPGELSGQLDNFRNDRSPTSLGRLNATALAWQNFTTKLQKAGYQIEASLVDGLGKAHVPEAMEKLSASVSKAVDNFLSNGNFQRMVEVLSKGVESLAGYMGSDKFKSDMKEFVSDVSDVASALVEALKKLGIIKDHGGGDAMSAADLKGYDVAGTGPLGWVTKADRFRAGYAYFRAHGLTDAAAFGVMTNGVAENDTLDPSRRQYLGHGKYGPGRGIFQWEPARQKDFERWSGHSFLSSTADEQYAFMLYEITHGKLKAAGEKLLKARSREEAAYIDSTQIEKPKGGRVEALGRASLAAKLSVQLKINNNTGGNANVQTTQAAAQ